MSKLYGSLKNKENNNENKKGNDDLNTVSNMSELSDEEEDDYLDNLPEFERELILAKRHEKYVRKKQRRMLLKNLNIDYDDKDEFNDNTIYESLNNLNNISIKHQKIGSFNKKENESNIQKKRSDKITDSFKLKKKTSNIEKEIEKKNKSFKDKTKTKNENELNNKQINESYIEKDVSKNIKKKDKIKKYETSDEHISDKYELSEVTSSSYSDYSNKNNKRRKENKKKGSNNEKTNDYNDKLMSSIKKKKKHENDIEIKRNDNKINKSITSEEIYNVKDLKDKKKVKSHIHKKESEMNIKNIKNDKNDVFNVTNEYHSKHIDDIKQNDFYKTEKTVKGVEKTSEEIINLYKEEKKIKLDIYKFLNYENITYFQLKKTFLLDMCEHVSYSYFVIGHLIKIIDFSKLIKVSDLLNNEKTNSLDIDKKNKNDKWSYEDKNSHRKNSLFYSNNKNLNHDYNNTHAVNDSYEYKNYIFFITNVIKTDNYFSNDRETNIKFEITGLNAIYNKYFFDNLRNLMRQNKKLSIDNLSLNNYITYICDMNNISNKNFSVDEFNYIKLYTMDVELLKNFYNFLKYKIQDLKHFHFTEKQIQDLIELKKKEKFNEIYTNKKDLDTLQISRVVVQREICSILREIDILNYTKNRTNKDDKSSIEKINSQINHLTNKIDILRQQLDKNRSNITIPKFNETLTSEKEKYLLKEKSLNNILKNIIDDDLSDKHLVNDQKSFNELTKNILEEKKNSNKLLTNKLSDISLETNNKIVQHFLLGSLMNDNIKSPFNFIEKNEQEMFNLPTNYIITLDEFKKSYE